MNAVRDVAADADAPAPRIYIAGVADIVMTDVRAGRIRQRHAKQRDELIVHLLTECAEAEHTAIRNGLLRRNLHVIDLLRPEPEARCYGREHASTSPALPT